MKNHIKTLNWPAYSPDLNPIENLWGILCNNLYCNNKQYENTDELINAIKEEWQKIDQNMLKDLVKSIPNRLVEVVKNKGG